MMGEKEKTMATDQLNGEELAALVQRVFEPGEEDRTLAVIVDLPDDEVEDNPRWRERRALAGGCPRPTISTCIIRASRAWAE